MARPSKYRDEFNELARKHCLLGATDLELADLFEVCEKTINTWKIQHPEFLQSIKKGKDYADQNVAERLFERAMGYEHEEDKIFNNGGEALVVPTIKHYPPDATSAIFWLKNRQSSKWRDQQHVNNEGSLNLNLTISKEEAAVFNDTLENEN